MLSIQGRVKATMEATDRLEGTIEYLSEYEIPSQRYHGNSKVAKEVKALRKLENH